MSHYGSGVEIGLHCLLHLAGPDGGDAQSGGETPSGGEAPSTRDLAEFQGVSPSFTAKIFTQLEKAGIVRSAEGVRGGFALARPAEAITVLDVVDAIEGEKPLFQCRDIRDDCVLAAESRPGRGERELCGIHALMLAAEERMRGTLAETTLADLAGHVEGKVPRKFFAERARWFRARHQSRGREPEPTRTSRKERRR